MEIQVARTPPSLTLWQPPGKQHPAAAGQNKLLVVEFIGNRRTRDLRSGAGVPQSFAIAGIERENVSHGVTSEGDAGIRGQHSRGRTFSDIVAPANFSGLIVDSFDLAPTPDAVVGASPAVG